MSPTIFDSPPSQNVGYIKRKIDENNTRGEKKNIESIILVYITNDLVG